MKRKKIFKLSLISILLVLNILFFEDSKFQVLQGEHCNWADIDCSPYLQEYTQVFAEETWGQVGIVAYPAAARWMSTNNSSSQTLDDIQKQHLRLYFGDLVDRVTVVYNAKLMDDWLYAGFKIDIGQVDAIAQTYCNRIYVEGPYQPNNPSHLMLLAHELVHSKQCERLGGKARFGYYYFKEFKKAGQNYENNKLEREANDIQQQFAKWLSHHLANDTADLEQG